MAGTKISALAELTALDPQTDWLPIVDVSDTAMAASGTDKKIKADLLTVKGADIASATPNLATATGRYVHITGTTTITAFGTVAAGVWRILRFAGTLTLTHNATSLILPTAANITTAANDMAIMVSEGSGNWRCVSYERASGASLAGGGGTLAISGGGTGQVTAGPAFDALTVKGTDIASATPNLATATGSYVEVTGVTTITSFGSAAAGVQRWVRFMGALTITHNATSMILPGGVNIVTEAGDRGQFASLGSGNWVCLNFMRMSGREIINVPTDPVPVRCVRSMTAAAYAALGGGVDANTIYFIVG